VSRGVDWARLPAGSGRLLLAVAAAGALLFAVLGAVVGTRGRMPREVSAMGDFHRGIDGSATDSLMKAISFVGGPPVLLAIALAFAVFLGVQRRRVEGLFVLVAVGGAYPVGTLAKHAFHRTRPDLYPSLAHAPGYSFPSGHANGSMAFAFALSFLAWQTRRRRLVVALAALFVVLVGASRVYLGVHYPTDVLGGWAAGATWVALIGFAAERRAREIPGA
jgi:membrane-associated phospholipid phosphatase